MDPGRDGGHGWHVPVLVFPSEVKSLRTPRLKRRVVLQSKIESLGVPGPTTPFLKKVYSIGVAGVCPPRAPHTGGQGGRTGDDIKRKGSLGTGMGYGRTRPPGGSLLARHTSGGEGVSGGRLLLERVNQRPVELGSLKTS